MRCRLKDVSHFEDLSYDNRLREFLPYTYSATGPFRFPFCSLSLARERVGVRVVPGAIAPPHPHPLPLEGARERHDAQKLNDRGCG